MNTNIFSCFTLFVFYLITDKVEGRMQYEYVTCGSMIKLKNVNYGARLHSHDVKYGSGSQQQSVTAVHASEDNNSYWRIRGKIKADCTRGVPIKCGQTVRLTHMNTGRNLHSHHFQSPLSSNYEVSAFGEDGQGDDGDHWTIQCDETSWRRDEEVRLKHVVTGGYLHINGETYGRPIKGQMEVSAAHGQNSKNLWKVAEGVYVKPTDTSNWQKATETHQQTHDEL